MEIDDDLAAWIAGLDDLFALAPIFTQRIDAQSVARRPGSKDSLAPPGALTAIHHVRDP
jgi:hypothetical protein